MAVFPMCTTCREAYGELTDRRDHARVIACLFSRPDVLHPGRLFGVRLEEVIERVGKLSSATLRGRAGRHP